LTTFAQNSEVFKIDFLPKHGVLPGKGRRFTIGDNPDWAKPEMKEARPDDPVGLGEGRKRVCDWIAGVKSRLQRRSLGWIL